MALNKTWHVGTNNLTINTVEILINEESFYAISKSDFDNILKPKLKLDYHPCVHALYCGLVGDAVPIHTQSHWKCHPIFQSKSFPRSHQGSCVMISASNVQVPKRCTNRNATKICLRCSSVDNVVYICSERVGDCYQHHIQEDSHKSFTSLL